MKKIAQKHFKKLAIVFVIFLSFAGAVSVKASDIIPTGNMSNLMYYKIGGGADFPLPPVQNTSTINLGVDGDLGAGYTCGAFNPALSLSNTFNNLKNSVDNLAQDLLNNATGSLAEIPMYFLAQANPTAYNLINNALLSAHNQLDISSKSCQTVKEEISKGQNPYQDWATISVGNQWKQHLSLTASGSEDINDAKKDVDAHSGDTGVQWVQGTKGNDGSFYAGGLSQPPIHAVADTVRAGYNAMLGRSDLNSNDPAPQGGELSKQFPQPSDAVAWITNVVGDQTVTTCNAGEDPSCKSNQGGISGRGLLPWITCTDTSTAYCSTTIHNNLVNLISGQTPITKDNLETVSASGLVISPQVISSIRSMDPTQQGIVVNKLAQEVATQRVIDRALMSRSILQTGSQVPVIASNQPAQKIINQAIQHLDKDIQSLSFESQVRKQMMSDTLSQVLNYTNTQQESAMSIPKVAPAQPFIQNGAISNQGGKSR
jgi:integrating conjugative element protein (TIGR03755 family)